MIFNLGVKRISKVPASVLKAGKERKVVEEVPVEEVIEKIQSVKLNDIVDIANAIFIKDKMTLVSLGKINQEKK